MGARLPLVPKDYDQKSFAGILQRIENRLDKLEAIQTPTVFTITTPSSSTTLDVATATLAQLAAFVGTLVIEMQKAGKLGKP